MSGQEKFDTCIFRSKEKHFSQEVTCCGAKQQEGYLCIRKRLGNVLPVICSDCIFYEKKENGQKEN